MNLVFYVDGSSRPNPGYAGFGLFGYSYVEKESKNLRKRKIPFSNKLYFSKTGINENKDNIEVERIYLYSKSLMGSNNTNNVAELKSVLKALEIACEEECKSLLIITDSAYIKQSFEPYYERWCSLHSLDINTKNQEIWISIFSKYKELINKSIKVNLQWVKAHSGIYGNETADILSAMGSVYSINNNQNEDKVILDVKITYDEYKSIFDYNDFVLSFKEMYFSSSKDIDDDNLCFLSDSNESKTKSLSSIYAINAGKTPEIIRKIKYFFKNIERNDLSICFLKIHKIISPIYYKILFLLDDPSYVISKDKTESISYSLINDSSPLVYDIVTSKSLSNRISSHVIEIFNLFNNMHDLLSNINFIDTIDITYKIYDTDKMKLKIDNKVNYIDITDDVNNLLLKYKNEKLTPKVFKKCLLKVGEDIPSFLSLKLIEKEIIKIYSIVRLREDSSNVKICTYIECKDRKVITSRYLNNYLIIYVNTT
ncbi:MAG: RNase H family protein [Candidatus Aenigmatarchaeota archaeon]